MPFSTKRDLTYLVLAGIFITNAVVAELIGLTYVTAGLILYTFLITVLSVQIPTASFSPVSVDAFDSVFGQSQWIMVGSLVAFVFSQLIDVVVFWAVREKTKGKWLWARATGSTVVSQLVDTFLIMGIAFWLPGKISTEEYIEVSTNNYLFKFIVAVGMTPVIYLGHAFIDRFLGDTAAQKMIEEAAAAEKK